MNHTCIQQKLDNFIAHDKIPNLLFYGKTGSGKKTLLNEFLHRLYNGEIDDNAVMFVNCSHGKGIKFIRNELKFFAKTNMTRKINAIVNFKSIILYNADNLTIDAQSALRRIIELYSQTTRFFIIAENKNKLMKPILSRLCEIFVSNPPQSLQHESISTCQQRLLWLKKDIITYCNINDVDFLHNKSILYYEKGYSANDVIEVIETKNIIDKLQLSPQYMFTFYIEYNNMRKEVRNDVLLILKILSSIFCN